MEPERDEILEVISQYALRIIDFTKEPEQYILKSKK